METKQFKINDGEGHTLAMAEAASKSDVERYIMRKYPNISADFKVTEVREDQSYQQEINNLADEFERMGHSREMAESMAQGRGNTKPEKADMDSESEELTQEFKRMGYSDEEAKEAARGRESSDNKELPYLKIPPQGDRFTENNRKELRKEIMEELREAGEFNK